MLKLEKKIYDIMEANRISGEIVDYNKKMIAVEIRWGDWKHDHARFDWLMEKNFSDIKRVKTHITEDNGSDCYSAIHYYEFT